MATANPNTCPHCGSSNSGANFGFNPQRINNDETLIHDVLFACADCDGQWAAIGDASERIPWLQHGPLSGSRCSPHVEEKGRGM